MRSPIAGRVVAMPLALGQVVTGTEEVATVAQPGGVWASLRVPEADYDRLNSIAAIRAFLDGRAAQPSATA